jgi:hypothetical protein
MRFSDSYDIYCAAGFDAVVSDNIFEKNLLDVLEMAFAETERFTSSYSIRCRTLFACGMRTGPAVATRAASRRDASWMQSRKLRDSVCGSTMASKHRANRR